MWVLHGYVRKLLMSKQDAANCILDEIIRKIGNREQIRKWQVDCMEVLKVQKGQIVAKKNDKVKEWYFIQEGSVIQKLSLIHI